MGTPGGRRRSRARAVRVARAVAVTALLLGLPACGLRVGGDQLRAAMAGAEGAGHGGGLSGGAAGTDTGVASAGDQSTAQAGVTGAGAGGGTAGGGGAAGGPSVGSSAPSGGNGGATDVGVTGDTITVGNVSDLGGPVPGLFQGGPYGTQAYFDYVNSQGGVFGRKLKLVTADDQLQCSQNEAAYQNLVNQVFAFVGSWSLDDNCGAQVLQQHADVPAVNQSLSPQFQSLPGEFSVLPFGQGAPVGPFLYYKQKYPDAVTSVGTLVGNQPSAVAAWKYQQAAMESVGYKVVYEDDFPPAQSNFTADVVRMRSQNVKMVYLVALNAPDAAEFAAEAAQQNWHPEVWACAICYYGAYVQNAQSSSGPANLNGQYVNLSQSMFLGEDVANVPQIAVFQHWLKQAYPSFAADQFSATSWSQAALFVDALRKVGPHLTRKAVLAALSANHSYNADGMFPTVDVGSKTPTVCYLLVQIQNGKYVKVDDPPTGFRCDGSYFHAR